MIIIIWGYLGITPQTNKPWFILNVLTHTHSCRLCPFLKKPTAAWIQPNLSNLGRSNPENKNPGIILAIICSDAIHIYNMILYIYTYMHIHIHLYRYIWTMDDYGVSMCILSPSLELNPRTWPVQYCASNALGTCRFGVSTDDMCGFELRSNHEFPLSFHYWLIHVNTIVHTP